MFKISYTIDRRNVMCGAAIVTSFCLASSRCVTAVSCGGDMRGQRVGNPRHCMHRPPGGISFETYANNMRYLVKHEVHSMYFTK